MTTYKLPEWMGGTEAALIGGIEEDGTVRLAPLRNGVISNARVTISVDDLTEVKPEEPEHDAVLVDRYGGEWLHGSHGWFAARHHGPTGFVSWPELHRERGPLTQLVADPVASAPELPFLFLDGDDNEVTVEERTAYPGARVEINGIASVMDPDVAERFAYAILRAAREARAAS